MFNLIFGPDSKTSTKQKSGNEPYMMGGRLRELSVDIAHRVRSQSSLANFTVALDAVLANSVDSGATQVLVIFNIETMGFTVMDNGCGIHPEDMSSVGKRHWTTKIHHLEQLERLSTRGFRGEALSSIAAVSSMTVKSKTTSFNGTYMTRIHNGERTLKCVKMDDQRLSSCGTEIHVEQMFSNTPVRLKHIRQVPALKTIQTIRKIVIDYAISYPHIRLTVRRQQGNEISSICCVNSPRKARMSAGEKWAEIFEQVYGIDLGSSYKYATQVSSDMKIQLFISSIPLQTKAYQFTFINQRMTDSNFKELINQELSTEANDNRSMDKSPKKTKQSATLVGTAYNKYLAFILHVEHKRATRNLENGCAALPDDDEVSRRVSRKVKEIAAQLKGKALDTPDIGVKGAAPTHGQARPADTSLSVARFAVNSRIKLATIRTRELEGMIADKGSRANGEEQASTIGHLKRRKLVQILPKDIHDHAHSDDPCNDESGDEIMTYSEEQIPKELFSSCSVISQVDDKFILIKSKTSSKLYIVDQHACDERIQVEELYKDVIQRATDVTRTLANPLEENITTKTSRTTLELLNTYKDQLDHWGIRFIIKPSNSPSSITFTHLPEVMHAKVTNDSSFIISSIIQFLHDLNDKRKLSTIPKDWYLGIQAMPTILILLLNSKACRSAIMFGQKLSKLECELMMNKLSECRQPFQCAHGRPSIVPLCDISQL
jgi:DNA mismatch repair protein MLH3